jgi:hypothetical protein
MVSNKNSDVQSLEFFLNTGLKQKRYILRKHTLNQASTGVVPIITSRKVPPPLLQRQ